MDGVSVMDDQQVGSDPVPRDYGSIAWHFVNNLSRRPFSRIVLLLTIAMTWRVTEWAFEFAKMTAGTGGFDVAATMAAVTAPFAALQGVAFRVYTDGKES